MIGKLIGCLKRRDGDGIKQTCQDCHFLTVTHRTLLGEPPAQPRSWTPAERAEMTVLYNGEPYSMYLPSHVGCHRGVWDTEVSSDLVASIPELLTKDREGTCFFFPYEDGMALESAKELEIRRSEDRKLKRDLRNTRIGLVLATLAWLTTLAFRLLDGCGSGSAGGG